MWHELLEAHLRISSCRTYVKLFKYNSPSFSWNFYRNNSKVIIKYRYTQMSFDRIVPVANSVREYLHTRTLPELEF